MKRITRYIFYIAKLLKLETMTMAGRVNLAFAVLIVTFVVVYTANDTICYLISAVRDAVKTITLKQNISESYQTVSVFKISIPVIFFMFFCLFYLYWDDKKKKKIDDE